MMVEHWLHSPLQSLKILSSPPERTSLQNSKQCSSQSALTLPVALQDVAIRTFVFRAAVSRALVKNDPRGKRLSFFGKDRSISDSLIFRLHKLSPSIFPPAAAFQEIEQTYVGDAIAQSLVAALQLKSSANFGLRRN